MRVLPNSAAFFLLATSLQATDPVFKEGLWSMHMETTSQPGNDMDKSDRKICRDHASDEQANAIAKKGIAGCKLETEDKGGKIVSHSECTVGGILIKTQGTATYSGESSHSETHTTYIPAFQGKTESTSVIDQKYIGSCPAGIGPGDMVLDDGTVRKARKR